MRENEPKQVLIVNRSLKMGTGKIAAQCAHASLAVILGLGKICRETSDLTGEVIDTYFHATLEQERMIWNGQPDIKHDAVIQWLEGRFTKVVCYVDSDEELVSLYEKAQATGIPSSLITDAGFTHFNGVPTRTVVAIGPEFPDKLDKITGHLKLL